MAVPIPVGVDPFVRTVRAFTREAVNAAVFAARYPLGVFDGAMNHAEPCGDDARDTPVLLLHGFGHNHSGWFVLQRRLAHAGFTSVHTLNYEPWRRDVPALAQRLADRVEFIRGVTGASRVNVIGHSLGGVVLRWYVQELGGDQTVKAAITIASPHHGTRIARFLAPGSWLIRKLEQGARPSPVRWVAFYSNLDVLIQPTSSAKLTDPALAATNIPVNDVGHLSILLSRRVGRGIVDALCAPMELSIAS